MTVRLQALLGGVSRLTTTILPHGGSPHQLRRSTAANPIPCRPTDISTSNRLQEPTASS